MSKTAVRTWADSFGIWNAEVLLFSKEVTLSAIRSRARRAILSEINARQAEVCTSMPLVLVSCEKDDHDGDMIYAMTYREAF